MLKSSATLLLVVTTIGTSAHAARGVQITREGRRTMVSKDVGADRWAINFNQRAAKRRP
jgi:hypothetical protein